MFSIKKNRRLAVTSLSFILLFGCTATGEIDWGRMSSFTGTILQSAAQNYTGAYVGTVDALFNAITGQEVQRPFDGQIMAGSQPQSGSQYPGYSQYPGQMPPTTGYPNQYPPGSEYPGQTPSSSGYPGQTPSSSGYPGQTPPGSSYPGQQSGGVDPSWQPWGDPFPSPSLRVVPDANAMSIDFALVKASGRDFVTLYDGDRLRDGINRPEAGDRYGISFSTNESLYVYIENIDATGWAQTLFPYPEIAGYNNPVAPGRPILLPNEQLYGLDDSRGVETVFTLVSRSPNYELENALAPLRGQERNASIGTRGVQSRVNVPFVGQRGLTGIIPGATQSQNMSLDRYFTDSGINEVAFNRWFYHE